LVPDFRDVFSQNRFFGTLWQAGVRIGVIVDRALEQPDEGALLVVGQVEGHTCEMGSTAFGRNLVAGNFR
jgi:hypothetical protein